MDQFSNSETKITLTIPLATESWKWVRFLTLPDFSNPIPVLLTVWEYYRKSGSDQFRTSGLIDRIVDRFGHRQTCVPDTKEKHDLGSELRMKALFVLSMKFPAEHYRFAWVRIFQQYDINIALKALPLRSIIWPNTNGPRGYVIHCS